ncbi:3'5'-cyclic nucleotide phosphodiesterase domain-containing protein [Phthorimaea operculella]|nr:3'5'-cyclic nucleotide phosphodiesterase domain-containing protein [Phthorimaea operculella]
MPIEVTLDEWSFDVFALHEAANGAPVKYLGYELLNRYGMIHKFKVSTLSTSTFTSRGGERSTRQIPRLRATQYIRDDTEVQVIYTNYIDTIYRLDVFALHEANGAPVKYLGYELLNRYGMIHKFKVPPTILENFLSRIEEGYCKFHNPYHNNLHAADVAQTVHYMLCQTGLMNWLSDLEIFATLVAAVVHDFEHTGTTNNFHVMSGSETALLYNDRAVLENHHISAAFRLMRDEECNILQNLSRDEFREFRTLVIDMVLATDMSFHFQQLKNMRSLLSLAEPTVDKSKVASLVLHCCDISHPSKRWDLHHRWTMSLLDEFFLQGDKERDLGLPFSPLCDRNNTLVAESQIGFIEFIVEPSMGVCADMLECVLGPLHSSGKNSTPPNQDSISEEGERTTMSMFIWQNILNVCETWVSLQRPEQHSSGGVLKRVHVYNEAEHRQCADMLDAYSVLCTPAGSTQLRRTRTLLAKKVREQLCPFGSVYVYLAKHFIRPRDFGLHFSSLCDRNNTLVAESQIGFIEFIVEPSMGVCADMLECVLGPLHSSGKNSTPPNQDSISEEGVETPKFKIRKPWIACLSDNKKIWKEQAAKDAEARKVGEVLANRKDFEADDRDDSRAIVELL